MSGPIVDFSRSYELNKKLHDLIPGGSHTYSKGDDQFPWRGPKVMKRAEGAWTWDVDDNRYLDWMMGNRVIILGHAHPAVNEAVKRQLDLGLNFSRPSLLEYELAEFLVDLLPVAEMVKFGKNGSDVTSAAVKLARAYTDRPYVAFCQEHPFFSIHDWFIGRTPMNAGIPDGAYENTLTFRYNDIAGVEELFARHPGKIAALILEPVKNDPPIDGFLEKLREITRRENAVLIFDEMIAAPRFDLRGAHHKWGVYPDLACYGKAISNGYSFSVLAGRRDLMELGGLRHDKRRVFLLSQTHSSEAVGLAACRATLEECIRLDVTTHLWTLGKQLVDGLRTLAASEGVSEHVRVIGYDCNPQLICTTSEGNPWPSLHAAFHQELISYGILMPWTSITWAHGPNEVAMTLEAAQAAMRFVRKALETETVETCFEGEAGRPVFRAYNR